MSDYVRTDTAEDLVSTLEAALEFLQKAQTDTRYWKWFIHAMHSATQSTAALVLDLGNGFLVQKPGVMKRMLDAHEHNGPSVLPHMDNFSRLIEKALLKENLRWDAKPLIDSGHTQALQSLDHLRDGFAHFNVKSWSIGKLHVAESAQLAVEFIIHYICVDPAILWYKETYRKRAVAAVNKLNIELKVVCEALKSA